MSIIKARNNFTDSAAQTFLASPYGAGGTALPIKNPSGFFGSWAIQIGETGGERSEIKVLDSATPSGTVLNLTGTTLYSHPTDTPIYAIKYDKIVFKRSTDGTSGTATAISSGTVNITPDSDTTIFDDTSGLSTYAYKIALYNSVLDVSSSDSDWLTPSGYSFYSLAKVRERVKRKLFSFNFIKEDSYIDDWINEWIEKMNNAAVSVNQDYSLGTVDVAHGTNGLATITTSNFKDIRKVDYTTDGVNFYRGTKFPTGIVDFMPHENFNASNPYYYFLGDNVVGKKPEGDSGTARIVYNTLFTPLTDDTDELPVTMRGYSKSFVDYGLSQAHFVDNKVDLGNTFLILANNELEMFINEITPRSRSGGEIIDFIEATSAEDDMEIW